MRILATLTIILSFIGLCTYGLLFVYSSTMPHVTADQADHVIFSSKFKKQLIFIGLGIGILYIFQRFSYTRLLRPAFLIYLGTLALLIYTTFFGRVAGGARSWLSLGFMNIQPSELMKVAWIIYLAAYLRYRKSYQTLSGLFPPIVITAVPLLFVLKQPDLGTAFIFIPTLFFILYLVGARVRHLMLLIAIMIAMTIPMYKYGLKPYQKGRLLSYLDPGKYELTYAFQLNRSLMAIGEGHWLGTGLGKGQVNRFNMLPDRHTDFIFSIIAEELGFIGAMGLLACYLAMLFSFLILANFTREPFGRNIVIGLGTMLAIQVFINLGVTIGLLPTTGITLPFISAGGSSFLTSCLMIGIALSVSRRHVPVLSKEDFSVS